MNIHRDSIPVSRKPIHSMNNCEGWYLILGETPEQGCCWYTTYPTAQQPPWLSWWISQRLYLKNPLHCCAGWTTVQYCALRGAALEDYSGAATSAKCRLLAGKTSGGQFGIISKCDYLIVHCWLQIINYHHLQCKSLWDITAQFSPLWKLSIWLAAPSACQ